MAGKEEVGNENHKLKGRKENWIAEVEESGDKGKLFAKEKIEGGVETEMPKEENKAKLEDRPVENEKTMQREIDKIKGVEDKDEVLNIEKRGLAKEGNEQHDKGIKGKIEIANEFVEKDLLIEMGKNEGATESVNYKKELPENGPIKEAHPEQKIIFGDMAGDSKALKEEFRKIMKSDKSYKTTGRANGPDVVEENRVKVAEEEVNANVYNDGELVFKIDTYSLLSLFSI